MKKFIVWALLLPMAAWAQQLVTLSNLPPAQPLVGNEKMPGFQQGSCVQYGGTCGVTPAQLAIYANSVAQFSGDCTGTAGVLLCTKLNGGTVPSSALITGTNGSSQVVATQLPGGTILGNSSVSTAAPSALATLPFALLSTGNLTQAYSSSSNIAIGAGAEQAAITGTSNNAIGFASQASVTSGVNNNSLGWNTLNVNQTGSFNDAMGNDALRHTTGSSNTAIGEGTLFLNTVGSGSTAVGNVALLNFNGAAGQETAVGYQALTNDLSGQGNVALGFNAGEALTTGSNNTLIGTGAGISVLTTGSNNVIIGNSVDASSASASNTLNLDNILTATGTGTPGTSTSTIAGSLTVTGNLVVNSGTVNMSSAIVTGGAFEGANGNCTTPAFNFALGGNTNYGFFLTSGTVRTCVGGTTAWIVGTPTSTLGSHLAYTSGSLPVVSACGTTPAIDSHATDASGTVTVGTVSATSCTVTFATAYATWNHCRVTTQTTISAFAYSYSLSAITITGTSLVGDKLDYDCDGT